MGFISNFMADPRSALIVILLMLPGHLFALSVHEYAHARTAYKFGDNTANMLGRMTLNPFKHIDPLGFVMIYIAGFGWAKPVPINPRNFRGDYRKADLLVSIAGVTMNFLMFLAGAVVLYAVVGVALAALGTVPAEQTRLLLANAPYLGQFLIRPLWGDIPYYLFQMLSYFVQINIVLAIFNLIPLPPLDGYHVLNDLVLKRELFAGGRAAAIGQVVLIALLFSGVLSDVLGFIIDNAFLAVGSAAGALFNLLGIL
ncbi:MAG: site-2 protease family protein [Clostridiales bacterium]|nr:site-2 protease family protein [Clostridiales bacterium]